jgi:chemotaxis signal transduction protein
VMVHEGEVIPLVDFRSAGAKTGQMLGAPLLIVLVHGRAFGIAVDRVQGRTDIALSEIRAPGEELARRAPCLAGLVWREGRELFLIDSDRLLGPAVRTHLLKAD